MVTLNSLVASHDLWIKSMPLEWASRPWPHFQPLPTCTVVSRHIGRFQLSLEWTSYYRFFLYLRNSAFLSRFNSNTASSQLGRIPLMQHLLISIATLGTLFHQSLFPGKSLKPETMSCFASLFFWIFIIYLLIFGCAGSSLLHTCFSGCGKWGLLSSCGARASHCRGFSRCRARALGVQTSVVSAHKFRSFSAQTCVCLSCPSESGTFLGQEESPVLEGGFFNHWTTWEVLFCLFRI